MTGGTKSLKYYQVPCVRLARLKFELTIRIQQDSAGEKNFNRCPDVNVSLTGKVRKGFEIRQLFSLEIALLKYSREVIYNSKTLIILKK